MMTRKFFRPKEYSAGYYPFHTGPYVQRVISVGLNVVNRCCKVCHYKISRKCVYWGTSWSPSTYMRTDKDKRDEADSRFSRLRQCPETPRSFLPDTAKTKQLIKFTEIGPVRCNSPSEETGYRMWASCRLSERHDALCFKAAVPTLLMLHTRKAWLLTDWT